ncbi:MAG: CocE/NonD family hydrolase, partial [Halobacteria archaeon]|nr:CocE/NonD family hydrolase [Halobacteria archaeon]
MQGTRETNEEKRPGSRVEQDPTIQFSVDGETVAATRYEPTDVDGPSPAVLWYTPYHKDDQTTFGRYDPLLEYIAAHGYEVVAADMVGTGASTGYRDEFLGPD